MAAKKSTKKTGEVYYLDREGHKHQLNEDAAEAVAAEGEAPAPAARAAD